MVVFMIKNYLHISALELFYRFFPSPHHTVPSGPAGSQCSCRLASPGRLTRTVWRRLSCSRSDTHPRTQSDTPAQRPAQSAHQYKLTGLAHLFYLIPALYGLALSTAGVQHVFTNFLHVVNTGFHLDQHFVCSVSIEK